MLPAISVVAANCSMAAETDWKFALISSDAAATVVDFWAVSRATGHAVDLAFSLRMQISDTFSPGDKNTGFFFWTLTVFLDTTY